MAQSGVSIEKSSQPTSSLPRAHGQGEGHAKDDGTDFQFQEHPNTAGLPVPARDPSESAPSGEKRAESERSSERKQPARASKRDIVFVRIHTNVMRSNRA